MKRTSSLVKAAVTAALYVALTSLAAPISYGPVQLRISEALTVLPLFFVEAVPGLAVGCFLANMLSSPLDMAVGSLATLLAAVLTYRLKNVFLGIIPPIVINAFAVPIIFLTMPEIAEPYWFNVLTVGIGQAVALIGLGLPLYYGLKRVNKRYALFGANPCGR